MIRLGVIGYGARIQGVLHLIDCLGTGAEVTAITDVRNEEITRQMKDGGREPSKIAFYADPDEMLDNEELDGVLIGTRCSLHSKMAIKVLQRNLPLYLEKPVATNMQDLVALRRAAEETSSEVVVSFPLRVTPLVQMAKEIIDSGKVGTIEHVEAWNDVPYAACYYQDWYRDENETQGLFLQKATHDFDYINYLLGYQPVMICAMTSKQVFKGDRPAGLKCSQCSDWDSCLESPFHVHFSKQEASKVAASNRMCAFAQDTGNEDSGSAIIRYDTGMHVCYSQDFIARKVAGRRGCRLFGYKGTIEFDWYTNRLKVFMHHKPIVETHEVDTSGASHGGGDTILADNFIRVILGQAKSVSPLSAGLLSALMCLKAKESAMTNTYQEVKWPDDKAVCV